MSAHEDRRGDAFSGRFRQAMDRTLSDLIAGMWAGSLTDEDWQRFLALLAIRRRRQQLDQRSAILSAMLGIFEKCPAELHHDAMVDRLALLTCDVPGSAVHS